MCKLLFCLTLCVFVGQVEAKIVANQLKCEQDGTSLTVYLAYDDTMLGSDRLFCRCTSGGAHNGYARDRA